MQIPDEIILKYKTDFVDKFPTDKRTIKLPFERMFAIYKLDRIEFDDKIFVCYYRFTETVLR